MNARPAPLDLRLVSLPMVALLVAQFLSALADNALLITAIALMKQMCVHGKRIFLKLRQDRMFPRTRVVNANRAIWLFFNPRQHLGNR